MPAGCRSRAAKHNMTTSNAPARPPAGGCRSSRSSATVGLVRRSATHRAAPRRTDRQPVAGERRRRQRRARLLHTGGLGREHGHLHPRRRRPHGNVGREGADRRVHERRPQARADDVRGMRAHGDARRSLHGLRLVPRHGPGGLRRVRPPADRVGVLVRRCRAPTDTDVPAGGGGPARHPRGRHRRQFRARHPRRGRDRHRRLRARRHRHRAHLRGGLRRPHL